VNTNTLPDWVPVDDKVEAKSVPDGKRLVANALQGIDEWLTTEDVWKHSEVDLKMRQVRNCLSELHKEGYIERRERGRGKVVRDKQLDQFPKYGEIYHDNGCGNHP
jgi:hypothetical protein